ncbi:MAG TPA: hypothetical protein VFI13_02410 [Gemmatimonadales bacterium]|nr:hypothetical protein [Gemmatimonadales bacterium]
MPLSSFALLVGATPQWCRNAFAVLGLSPRYDRPTARRMALVHTLAQELDLPLHRGWALAATLLENAPAPAPGLTHIEFDRARFDAEWTTRLATLAARPPRGRGRPPRLPAQPPSGKAALDRARTHGLDLAALRVGLQRDRAARLTDLDAAQRFVTLLRR